MAKVNIPKVNILKNADFKRGQDMPTSWNYSSLGGEFETHRTKQVGLGLQLDSDSTSGEATYYQDCRAKAGEFYRIEVDVICQLTTTDPTGGVILAAQPLDANKQPMGQDRHTPPITQASKPVTIRTYWEAPPEAKGVRVSITAQQAKGQTQLLRARLIRILQPEEKSHSLAVPPPRHSLKAPRSVRSVCVCGEGASQRPITAVLSTYFGAGNISAVASSALTPDKLREDALILLDAQPPSAIRSLRSLESLAEDKIVVISLTAFAKLCDAALSVHKIEQNDDPIHAKVVFGDFATQGFALHDLFAYAWPGNEPGSFVQQQFRKTTKSTAFYKKNNYETLLESVCDQEETSERPICLFKHTERGAVFVLDIDPVEAQPSTFGEPNLAIHLLLSILGQSIVGLGQYTVPALEEADLRCDIREMALRLPGFVVHDEDIPADEVRHQIVTIGGDGDTFGLPLKPKPVILIRSGLYPGDMESIYSAWLWFKHLVRPMPHACPYVETLTTHFRLAWVPSVAPWQPRQGWQPFEQAMLDSIEVEMEDSEIAAVIDLSSVPINRMQVSIGGAPRELRYYNHWLPTLFENFGPTSYLSYAVSHSHGFHDRDEFDWRRVESAVGVDRLLEKNMDAVQKKILATGGTAIKLEVPGCPTDFVANSIHRTDYAATLLELTIGLQFGIIAVNRSHAPIRLENFPPVQSGDMIAVQRSDAMLKAQVSRAS